MAVIEIKREECTSCGFCVRLMPECFGFDEFGWAFVKSNNFVDFDKLNTVIKKCPSSCIVKKE